MGLGVGVGSGVEEGDQVAVGLATLGVDDGGTVDSTGLDVDVAVKVGSRVGAGITHAANKKRVSKSNSNAVRFVYICFTLQRLPLGPGGIISSFHLASNKTN
jgi:hypothetical protein